MVDRNRRRRRTSAAIKQRVTPARATVERLSRPRPEDWITGEFRQEAEEEIGLDGTVLPRGMDSTIRTTRALPCARPRGRLERLAFRVFTVSLVLFLVVFFGQGVVEGIAGLFASRGAPWRAIPVSIRSVPSAARVLIGDRARGVTPMSAEIGCRGESIRVRLEAPGHANWLWEGLCPLRGPLELRAEMQPR